MTKYVLDAMYLMPRILKYNDICTIVFKKVFVDEPPADLSSSWLAYLSEHRSCTSAQTQTPAPVQLHLDVTLIFHL